ncbi:Predicted thiol-disulfide oxidoreductase YuxK, DCC family [Shouchella lonarensis]|uniref:Predicted thiol-disulfide oxidoreductase YuxK, DCC family n=1 Tax=Shouchella lonarensis TaxID=1464122 RepID=A0A1G6IMP6_9BACI|nr:Predicted thiol-disulfide oxidoreductase YuxK, DCC family [Shouchella lonarensis]
MNVFNRIAQWNQTQHMLMGASLLRIAYGTILLYMYLMHYAQRAFLWGPHGIYTLEDSRVDAWFNTSFSLYHLHASPLYFEIIFHAGILVTLWFIIGYKGRIASIVQFIFAWSLFARNSVILDGGDNIMSLLLVYLLFANMTAYFSVDSYLKQRRGEPTQITVPPGFAHMRMRNLFHNLAILACMLQVCIMYFTSGLHKVMGELWQNGTAIYYILQVNEYTHPFFQQLISSSELLIVAATYATIVVQIAYPFLLVNHRTRYVVMAGVVGMHVGIAVVMGLFTFSFVMIANQLLFLRDREYNAISQFTKRCVERIKQRWQRKNEQVSDPVREGVVSAKISVFYDGWCPVCRKSMTRLQKWDRSNQLVFHSFREKEVLTRYQLDFERAEKRMITREERSGRMYEGIESVWLIARKLPVLWLFVPVLWIAMVLGFGQRIYDFLAERRAIIPVGSCEEEACEWQESERHIP